MKQSTNNTQLIINFYEKMQNFSFFNILDQQSVILYLHISIHIYSHFLIHDFDGIRRYSSPQPADRLHDEQAVSFGKHPSIRGQGTVRRNGVQQDEQQQAGSVEGERADSFRARQGNHCY